MGIEQIDIDKIIRFVQEEPRTVQDVSRIINRSWVTTNSYLNKIMRDTGIIAVKTFRKGTPGALKIVYLNKRETSSDNLKEIFLKEIKRGRSKDDFDFFEIFQYVDDLQKKVLVKNIDGTYEGDDIEKVIPLLRRTRKSLSIYSGNLTFFRFTEDDESISGVFEELLKRGVKIKVLCRLTVTSLTNINSIDFLIRKYKNLIEIRHLFQPLRGFIIDEKIARFKSSETIKDASTEKEIFYEIYDDKWVSWLQKVFWILWRDAIDYNIRVEQLDKFFHTIS